MHDLKSLRDDPDAFDAFMRRRGFLRSASEAIVASDGERRFISAELQTLQTERNTLAKQIGQAKRDQADTTMLEARGSAIRAEMDALEARLPALDDAVNDGLDGLPNILDSDVPDGPDETANVEQSRFGQIKNFESPPRQHFELGEALGLMDFATAGKIASCIRKSISTSFSPAGTGKFSTPRPGSDTTPVCGHRPASCTLIVNTRGSSANAASTPSP
jgi:seryl-tRNA synthetase